jgi:type II secretory pathway component PulM
MSRMPTSARDRRALLIGGAIVAAVLAHTLVVRPYAQALGAARDRLAVEREALARELAVLAHADRYEVLRRTADSVQLAIAPYVFREADDLMATAALAAYVVETARRSRVLIQEAETRQTEPLPHGVRRLQVDFRAETDFEGLMALLNGLESGTKLVRVTRLTVTRREVPGSGGARQTVLGISGSVQGVALPDDTPSTTALALRRAGAP